MLLDGLVASAAPEVLAPQAGRLRLVVLVHMPLGDETADDAAADAAARERAVLPAPPPWSPPATGRRRRLLDLYPLPADRVHVAEPGVDAADLAPGTAGRRGAAVRRRGDRRARGTTCWSTRSRR